VSSGDPEGPEYGAVGQVGDFDDMTRGEF